MNREPQSARVLVVEDDPSIAMGLEMNLSAEGYQVELATDGEDALRIARAGVGDTDWAYWFSNASFNSDGACIGCHVVSADGERIK